MMKWSTEAEAALKKVPFFVRKRVRARVEDEARLNGRSMVTLAEVKATQKRYLTDMAKEVKGYQVDHCFGPNGCPNRAFAEDGLVDRLEAMLREADLKSFLLGRVQGGLKFHHEFRVTVADCPNACSQPQIKDFGIIGACRPAIGDAPCTQCRACERVCREHAIVLPENDAAGPEIDLQKCVGCGQCIPVCPSGTLREGEKGFRVQVGGKLGRHPQLARELPGVYSDDQTLALLARALDLYKSKCTTGQRFGELLDDEDMEHLSADPLKTRDDQIKS